MATPALAPRPGSTEGGKAPPGGLPARRSPLPGARSGGSYRNRHPGRHARDRQRNRLTLLAPISLRPDRRSCQQLLLPRDEWITDGRPRHVPAEMRTPFNGVHVAHNGSGAGGSRRFLHNAPRPTRE